MAKVIAFRVARCEEVCQVISSCGVYKALKTKLDEQGGKDYVEFSMNTGNILPDTMDLRAAYRPGEPFRRTDVYCTKKSGNMMSEEGSDVCDFIVTLSENTWNDKDFGVLHSDLKDILGAATSKFESAGVKRRKQRAEEEARIAAEEAAGAENGGKSE